jgi:hypothetical protein
MVSAARAFLIAFSLAASLVGGDARADEPPVASLAAGGGLSVQLPSSVLAQAEVKRQLGSGLTTIFVLVVRSPDESVKGAGRVEVRYDLWDEVYLIRKIDFDGRAEAQRVAGAALEGWWRKSQLRVAAGARAGTPLKIDVTVLPFSAAEEEDARSWLAKSGGVGGDARGARSQSLVDLLIGTTVQARPIVAFHWVVAAGGTPR